MQMQGWMRGGGVWLKGFWDCVEEWKKRQKVPEPGPKNILLAALLTRLFTTLVGLAWLQACLTIEMRPGG